MNSPRFTPDWEVPFRVSPYRLRFELGGEVYGSEAPVPRFIQALGRARQVAQALFPLEGPLMGLVAVWPDSLNDLFAPMADPFQGLRNAGFTAPQVETWECPVDPQDEADEDPEVGQVTWRSFGLAGDRGSREVLMWCATAYEAGIWPKVPAAIYLVDPERQILMHIYDDRGMDVIALDPETLLPAYREFDEWLLDYDRERMSAAFG